MNTKPNPFASIAGHRGLSGPILFGMDNESEPGKVICHFVRIETQVFNDADGVPKFVQLGDKEKADTRLPVLADCFMGPANKVIRELLGIMSELMTALACYLNKPVAAGTRQERQHAARSLLMASQYMQTGQNPKAPDVR